MTSPLGLCVGGRAGGTTCIGLLRVCGCFLWFVVLVLILKMAVIRALGILQVGSRTCAWLDTSKEKTRRKACISKKKPNQT